jgi:hypothetical protein
LGPKRGKMAIFVNRSTKEVIFSLNSMALLG